MTPSSTVLIKIFVNNVKKTSFKKLFIQIFPTMLYCHDIVHLYYSCTVSGSFFSPLFFLFTFWEG